MKVGKIDKYFSWVKLGTKIQVFDRGILIENIFNFTVQIILLYFLWKGIYGGRETLQGRTFPQMIQYILLNVGINNIFIYPNIYFMSNDIKTGNIAHTLLRPIDYQLQFIFKNIGIIVPMIIISLFSISFFHIFIFPINSPYNIIYFCISLGLSFLTVITFDFAMGMLCFWTENSWGVSAMKYAIISFFSGQLIPLDFFPQKVADIFINKMPFAGIIYTPIHIFQNHWDKHEFSIYFLRQSLWIIVFISIGRFLFNIARKHVFINGG